MVYFCKQQLQLTKTHLDFNFVVYLTKSIVQEEYFNGESIVTRYQTMQAFSFFHAAIVRKILLSKNDFA